MSERVDRREALRLIGRTTGLAGLGWLVVRSLRRQPEARGEVCEAGFAVTGAGRRAAPVCCSGCRAAPGCERRG